MPSCEGAWACGEGPDDEEVDKVVEIEDAEVRDGRDKCVETDPDVSIKWTVSSISWCISKSLWSSSTSS